MPLEQEYVGKEEIGADSYLGPSRYKVTCRCRRCSKTYSYTVSRITDEDRPCPRKKCKEAAYNERVQREAENLARMLDEQRAPGHVGSPMVRNIDKTAEIVQQDHGLTNLKDNIRVGESMVPRLPQRQQDAADNFFNHKPNNDALRRNMNRLGAMALSGAFRGNALNPAQVIPAKPGEKVLRRVGVEKLRG